MLHNALFNLVGVRITYDEEIVIDFVDCYRFVFWISGLTFLLGFRLQYFNSVIDKFDEVRGQLRV